MDNTEVIDCKTEDEVIHKLCDIVETAATAAISEHQFFALGLSGGSLIDYLCKGLPGITTDWEKWQIFFCDERYVPEASADSTFGAYKKKLIPKTGLTEKQFNIIDLNLDLDNCAVSYEKLIKKKLNCRESEIPVFDMLLLGMGPDGHTCSLFPNHELLNEKHKLIAPIFDSPKPPNCRVTMTFPLINNANICIFAAHGKGKAETIRRVLGAKEDLPAGLVKPRLKLYWILDSAAKSMLD